MELNSKLYEDFDPYLNDDMLSEILMKTSEDEQLRNLNTRCEKVERKIILILGKSGMGKTTMIRTLMDPNYIGEQQKGTRDTEVPECHELSLDHPLTGKKIHITMMDTPGFFERANSLDDERPPEKLKELLYSAVEINISQIHSIMICIKYGERLSDEMIETIDLIEEIAGEDLRGNLAMILTCCELKEDELNSYINELRTNHKTKKILSYIKNRIYPLGANDFTTNSNFRLKPISFEGVKNEMASSVRFLRNKFIMSLFNLPEPSRSINMQLVKHKVQNAHKEIIDSLVDTAVKRIEEEKDGKIEELGSELDLEKKRLIGRACAQF
jgi:signal recognition particle receptor subunit beta